MLALLRKRFLVFMSCHTYVTHMSILCHSAAIYSLYKTDQIDTKIVFTWEGETIMKKSIKKIMGIMLSAMLLVGLFQGANFAATNATTNATIEITGDDAYILYINGVEIGRDWQAPGTDQTRWRSVETYNVTLLDDYIIAIEAADQIGRAHV